MSKLFILCGLPFSGKTYLSKKIAKYLPVVIISFDAIFKELEEEIGEKIFLKLDSWNLVKAIALLRLLKNLKKGKNIVWDSTNPLRKHREELIRIGKIFHAQNIVIHVNPPLAEIYVRRRKNRNACERLNRKSNDFEETLRIWEDPLEEERAIQITSKSDITEFINSLKSLETEKG